MKKVSINFFAFMLLAAFWMLQAGCQKVEPTLVFTSEVKKKLEANPWKRSSYKSTDYYQEVWTFKGGLITVELLVKSTGVASGRRFFGTYTVGRKFAKGVFLRILTIYGYGGNLAYKGTYEPLKLSKKTLKFAANGREDDNNHFTIEGGLKMLEFTKE